MNSTRGRSLSKSKYIKEKQHYEISDTEYMYEDEMKQKKVLLGKGSFATVYLVRHRHTKRLFALKVVN